MPAMIASGRGSIKILKESKLKGTNYAKKASVSGIIIIYYCYYRWIMCSQNSTVVVGLR